MNVYSTELARAHAYTGTQTVVAPPGIVIVLRDVDSYVSADLTGAINVYLRGDGGEIIDWWVCDVDTTIVHQWRGRQVFESGQSFSLTSDGPADWRCSGYELIAP